MSKLPACFNTPELTPRQEVNKIIRSLGYKDRNFDYYWMWAYSEIGIEWPDDYFVRNPAGYVILDVNGSPKTNYPNVAQAFKANNLDHPLDQLEYAGVMNYFLKVVRNIKDVCNTPADRDNAYLIAMGKAIGVQS